MNVLCRIGLHKWRALGHHGLVMSWEVQQCVRCKCGREVGITGTFTYAPEQMRAALASQQAVKP